MVYGYLGLDHTGNRKKNIIITSYCEDAKYCYTRYSHYEMQALSVRRYQDLVNTKREYFNECKTMYILKKRESFTKRIYVLAY